MYKLVIVAMALAGLLFTVPAVAQEPEDSSIYDKIWGYAEFVDNDDATVLQSLKFTGRLQGEAAYFSSDDHGDFDDIAWRRVRVGGKATLFHDFFIHVEADLDLNQIGSDDFYNRLTDAYIGWSPSKAFKLKVGKQSAGFTLDGATSSKKLLTLERSIVAGNLWFTTEYFTGVSASGTVDGWDYKLGGFSSGGENEFGDFDSGWFSLASIGHALNENTDLRFDYVHNEPDYSGDVGTKKLTDIVSAVTKSQWGQWGLWTDLSYAVGDDDAGQSDLIGLQVMPFYDFSDTWQGVFRYSMVHSTDGPSATLGRYPKKKLSGSKYEDIQDFFLGVNCFLYGHKLKWQTGVEYNIARNDSVGDDYSGWGVTTGVRISW